MTTWEPHYHWWCRHVVAQWTARPFIEQRIEQTKAETKAAEAQLRAEQSNLEKAKRVVKSGIRMPWFNSYPVIGSEDR